MSDSLATRELQAPRDIVARFEPARAAVRPLKCTHSPRCWVLCGPASMDGGKTGGRCTACGGLPNIAGNEALHTKALAQCGVAR